MNSNELLRACGACAWFVVLLAMLAPVSARAGEFDAFFQSSFDVPSRIERWAVTAGTWRIVNQELSASSEGVISLATVPTYDPDIPPHDVIDLQTLDVYLFIASGAANARAGAVFNFADVNNFHEVTLNAAGSVQLHTRIAGVTRVVASASTTPPGAGKWLHLTLIRGVAHTTVMINGVRVFASVLQGGLPAGDIGLLARNTRARFDDLDARSFGAQFPYLEDFSDRNATGWQPLSGSWSVESQAYGNSAVVSTAITRGPFVSLWDVDTAPFDVPYTFKVRMLNPYGGPGNLVGLAWVSDLNNYTEVVFSPTGEARLSRVSAGVRTTMASATYSGAGPNRWFEVEVEDDANLPPQFAIQRVKVNGVQLFDTVPNVRGSGTLSLITHWAPGRFDDLRAAPLPFRPLFENFDDGTAFEFARGAGWNLEDGMLTSTGIGAADLVRLQSPADWHDLDDIEYRARMVNHFANSGNLVGFTYGAKGPVRYEAVFSPTGVAHLRKVMKGVSTTLATASYSGGEPHQSFDAQLFQIGQRTTVKVNGATVFNNVLQPDAVGGGLGFVTHFTNAAIDDVLLARIGQTRYRLTPLTDLANPFGPSSNVYALNDHGEAVGESRNPAGLHTAVLWRQGQVIPLGANSVSAARGINNKTEIVGSNAEGTAFYWNDGRLLELSTPSELPEPSAEAFDINERGQIVGGSCNRSGCPALLWELSEWEPNGTVVELGDLPGGDVFGTAFAINDSAEIVGSSVDSDVGNAGAFWRAETVESLGHDRRAFDVNNRGQIVGDSVAGPARAATWRFFHEFTTLPLPLRRVRAAANGINERGEIVGWSTAGGSAVRGTLWQEGRATDLNNLIACGDKPASLTLGIATDINERGQIAVNATDTSAPSGPQSRAFLLTPVSARDPCN
jgi:probable HAF family extracellular repeat protein